MSATANDRPVGWKIADQLLMEFGRTEAEIEYALKHRQMTDTERELTLQRQRQVKAAFAAFLATE